MKRKFEFSIVLLLLLAVEPAVGFTGAQLVDKCNTSFKDNPNKQNSATVLDMALDSGSCAGFVGGVIHGVNLVGSMLQKQGATKKNFICLPHGLHAKDLVRITLNYYKKNPNDSQSPAQLGVYNAFTKKFPCKDN